VLLATVNSTLYKIVFVLHILSVVIGFGGVALAGIYGRVALENIGPVGGAIARTNTKAVTVAEWAIFSVPVWGIFLIILSDEAFTFGQPWVSASFTLYIIGLALALAVLRPGTKKFDQAVADPARGAEAERLGKTLAIVGGVTNVLWIVVIFLMVFKPGL
jgi:uncharacterized membrane protein